MTLGHNSGDGERLKSFIDRLEFIQNEIDEKKDDLKDVMTEAKSSGLDVSVIREILKIRKQDAQKRAEREAILELYLHSLGMLADLPLGQSAVARTFP